MLRRPSPRYYALFTTEKIFVIKKFIFFFAPFIGKEAKKESRKRKDENMFSSHEDIRQQIKLVMYQTEHKREQFSPPVVDNICACVDGEKKFDLSIQKERF